LIIVLLKIKYDVTKVLDMDKEHLIPAQLFCTYHEVEISFVSSLNEYGLIHTTRIDEEDYIDETELEKLERLTRLHNELEVNLQGIDVISHMLERMQQMQEELRVLREKVKFYE